MTRAIVSLFSSGIGDRDLPLTTQPGGAGNDRNAIFLQQVLDTSGQLLRHGAAKLHQFLHIETHLSETKTQPIGMRNTVRHLCTMQQRLGWNASPVQADPP